MTDLSTRLSLLRPPVVRLSLLGALVVAAEVGCSSDARGPSAENSEAAGAGGAPMTGESGSGGTTSTTTGGTGGTNTNASSGGRQSAGGSVATGGSTSSGGGSFGTPTFSSDFTNLDGWDLIDRRGDGASIGVVSHPSSEDNAVLALHYPGNPALGADDFRNPAYAVEVATPSDTPLHYGRYEVSVRFASCAADEELVNGIFTYFNDGSDENGNGIGDNSEIDIELLCGEPHLLWLTVWTDYESSPTTAFRKTTRVIDMRTGNYHQTRPGMEGQYDVAPAGNLAAVRETDFPNPDRFYVLGFDWQPGYVRYYAVLGGTEVELFNLEGMNRVPQRPSRFLLNLWHAHVHWLKGGSADYPEASSTMHVDSVRIWQQ